MARFIFITGGVSSSLGKGLASATIGALLQARGYSVRLRKLDPYLNVDPGTMSPFEHGEVFITDDGAETDLDIGHYERFTGVAACQSDSVSSGAIYSRVFEKERRGDYLGSTIQVIPHVTNEIKNFVCMDCDDVDFTLCEIGGTVGDIEGLPFFEAIRQLAQDRVGQCVFVHLTLIPHLASTGELKTKPTQHSVKELRSIGIQPDILVCRSSIPVPDRAREKISLFCSVPQERVVTALDLDCIYDAPLAYHKEKLDVSVLAAFRIDDAPKPDLACWERICYNRHHLRDTVRIAIVGKYVQLGDAYISLIEALKHSGISHLTAIDFVWVDSENMNENNLHEILSRCQGIVVPGGFGSRGAEGKIGAAQFARENKIPYLGICLGMQVALIEVARNLAELKSATSQEFVEQNSVERHEFVIRYMQQWLGDCGEVSHRKDAMGKGGTLRLGAYGITLEENSKVASIYGKLEITERHRHRFEVNVDYVEKFQECGVIFSGKSFHGQLPEIIEYADHPWFVGVQFHPELKSRPFAPHPLFLSFVEAALCQRGIENSHK